MPGQEHQRAPKRENGRGAVCGSEDAAQGGQTMREDTETGPAARWKRRMRLGCRCREGDGGRQQEGDKSLSGPRLLQTQLVALNRKQCQCQCQCQCREHQRQRIGRVAADARKGRWFAVEEVAKQVVRQDGCESEVVVDSAQWRQCSRCRLRRGWWWCWCCQIRMRERSGC